MIGRAGARAPEPPPPPSSPNLLPTKPRHNRPFEQNKELRLLQNRARQSGSLRNKVVQLAQRKEEEETTGEAGRGSQAKTLSIAVQVNLTVDPGSQVDHLRSPTHKDEAFGGQGDLYPSGRSQDHGVAAGGGVKTLAYGLKKEGRHGISDARNSARGSASATAKDGTKIHSPDMPSAAAAAENKLPPPDSSPFPPRRSSTAAARRFRPNAAAAGHSHDTTATSSHVGEQQQQQQPSGPSQKAWAARGPGKDKLPQGEECVQSQTVRRTTSAARKTTTRAVKTPARIVMNQQDQQQPSNGTPHSNLHHNQQYESHSGLSNPRLQSASKDAPKERIIHNDYDDQAPNLDQPNSRTCWANPSPAAMHSAVSPQTARTRRFHYRDSSKAAPRILHATLTPAPPPAAAESPYGKRVRMVQGQESRRGPRPKSVKLKADECSSHYQSSGSSGDSPRHTSRGVEEVGEVIGSAFQASSHRLLGQQSPRRQNPSHFASSLEMFKRRLKMNQIKLTRDNDLTVEEDYVIRLDDVMPVTKQQNQSQHVRHDMKLHPPSPSHQSPQHHHPHHQKSRHPGEEDTSYNYYYNEPHLPPHATPTAAATDMTTQPLSRFHKRQEEEQEEDAHAGHSSPNTRAGRRGESSALRKQTPHQAATADTWTLTDPGDLMGAVCNNGKSQQGPDRAYPALGQTRKADCGKDAAGCGGHSSGEPEGLVGVGQQEETVEVGVHGDEVDEEAEEEEDLLLDEVLGDVEADAEENRYDDTECLSRMLPDSSGADNLTYILPEEPTRAPLPQVKTYVLEEDVARRLQGRKSGSYDPPVTLTLQNLTMHNNVLLRRQEREKMRKKRAEVERKAKLLADAGGGVGGRGPGGKGSRGRGRGREEDVWMTGFTGNLDAELRMQRWLVEMEHHQRAVQPVFNQNSFKIAIPAT